MKTRSVSRLLVAGTALLFFWAAACANPVVSKAAAAKITVTPSAGPKGTPITIEGTGFKPGEHLDITMDLGDGRIVGLGTEKVEVLEADAAGTFKAQSAIPAVAKPGTYQAIVTGENGSKAHADLTVQ